VEFEEQKEVYAEDAEIISVEPTFNIGTSTEPDT
jgi:hypothetical protein